jgi:iron complex transport system substrate-binding protein
MQRIVSLLPAATEIVCALGFESALVGRSHECDYPPGVRALPALTTPAFDADGDSRAIDEQVRGRLHAALSLYQVDAERLRALRPDVIVTQAQCAVCAVSLDEVQAAVQDMLDTPAQIVSLEAAHLNGVLADIEAVAAALDAADAGAALARRLQTRIDEIAARAAAIPARPTVACIEWIDPLMVSGHWVVELAELAGGQPVFGAAGRPSPWIEWDDLWAADPDRIIVMACGFDIERARRELPALERLPGWASLRATRDKQVYLTDGNAYFNRPGPRLVESLEVLAEIIHPDAFAFGHEGTGWVRHAPSV